MIRTFYRTAAAVICVVLMFGACSETPSPDYVVRRFFGALQARSRPAMRSIHDNLLSSSTREALAVRAKALTERTGVPVAPWDVLVFRGFTRGDRVSERVVEQLSETEARVRVEFEWYVPEAGGTVRPAPEPVELRLVLEEGQWRVELSEIVSGLVGTSGS